MKIIQLLSLILMNMACLAEQNDNSKQTLSRYLKTAAHSAACIAQTCVFAKMAHRAHALYQENKVYDRKEANTALILGGIACSALGYGIKQSGLAAYNSLSRINKEQNNAEQQTMPNESRLKNCAYALLAGSGCLVSALGCVGSCAGLYDVYKTRKISGRRDVCLEFALALPTFAYCTYKAGSSCARSVKKAFASKKPEAAR